MENQSTFWHTLKTLPGTNYITLHAIHFLLLSLLYSPVELVGRVAASSLLSAYLEGCARTDGHDGPFFQWCSLSCTGRKHTQTEYLVQICLYATLITSMYILLSQQSYFLAYSVWSCITVLLLGGGGIIAYHVRFLELWPGLPSTSTSGNPE